MKLTNMIGIVAVAALALMAFASTASATTLETNGVKQTKAIELKASLSGSSILRDTSGNFANTCTQSTAAGSNTTSVTGTTVSGPISSLSFTKCTHESIIVDKLGSLSIEWLKETSGTVRASGAEVTVPVTIFGGVVKATCTTNNTDLGTVTGVSSGNAPLALNAVLNCGTFLPSAKWEATYLFTGPAGLGVTS
jgi:hypothetical protein